MPLASSYAEYYGAASAAEVIAAIKADAELGTASGGLVANAATAATQTSAATLRSAVGLESANLSHLVNAVVGKQNVTPNGDGTFDIAVRNAADTATLVTIQYNPETGVKTVL